MPERGRGMREEYRVPEAEDTAEVRQPPRATDRRGRTKAPYLMVIKGPSIGLVHKLANETTTLGRSSEAEVWLDDEGVSRKHASIVASDGVWELRDLDSRNGVFVNGERASQHALRHGDRLRLGADTVLKFSLQDELEERFQRQLYESAVRDALTGAFNKRYFSEHLKAEFAYAHRHQTPLSLVIFDVDRFKQINDNFGHQTGDYALRELVVVVSGQLRTEDVLSRYGGEEFVVTLRDTPRTQAALVAERVRAVIEAHEFAIDDAAFNMTVSLGVATLPFLGTTRPEDLIAVADRCLYEAKAAGRNRTIVNSLDVA